MSQEKQLRERLIAKFKTDLKRRGGIFTAKTRGRLLGLPDLPGRPKTKHDFWYDVRKSVETALIDLELFIEMADSEQVNQILTEKTLMPVVRALLWHPKLDEVPPDPNRAEIARLFIEYGFEYLGRGAVKVIKRTIDDALELSDYLASNVRLQSGGTNK